TGRARRCALGGDGDLDAERHWHRSADSPRAAHSAWCPRPARRRLERSFGSPGSNGQRERWQHNDDGGTVMKRYAFGVLAYLVPTFALGFVWHLVLFESYYDALAIYRRDIIIPFGFLSMVIQAAIFAWVYDKAFAVTAGSALSRALRYGFTGAVLSWSFT